MTGADIRKHNLKVLEDGNYEGAEVDAFVESTAKAFDELKASGKVRHFGVSNQNPYQMALLGKALDMPLCANQLQFGIMHTPMIQSGINVNMTKINEK